MDDIVPLCGNYCHRLSSRCRSVQRSLLVLMVGLLRTDVEALQVIGGSVTVEQGGTAILPCHVIDTNDDLTQISWQRRTREKPHNDNFLTILPRDGPLFVNGGDDRFKYIGNFNDKNGTLRLSNVALKDEGSYTCIFTLFPSGNQKTEIPLNLLVPPFTSLKDNLPFLGTEEVLFATCTAAGSRPPAEVRWLTGALGDKVSTTTNSTQYDNGTTTTVSSLFGVPTREINGQQVQCVISGDSLTKEETLPFKVQVHFSPTEVNIKAISEDSFECLAEANPNAKLTWSRSGQSLLRSAVKVEGAKLQLLSRTSDLNGLYECEASNAYGSKRGQLFVHVASGACSVAWALLGVLVFLNVTGAAAWCFYNSGYRIRRSDNTPDDGNTPDSERVQLRALSAGDDHGPHDIPQSPSSAHDDHGLPSRPDDDSAPEDDGRHVSLSPCSATDDHGPRDIPPSLSSAKDDHGPSRRPDDDNSPEDDRRHGPLSTSSAGDDHGPHNVTLSPRRAEDDHGPHNASPSARRAEGDYGLHDDRQHIPLSARSAHDDHGLPSRPDDDHAPEDDGRHDRRAEVDHRPNDDSSPGDGGSVTDVQGGAANLPLMMT